MKLSKAELLLFSLILLAGIFARVWNFADMPPGLNVDEASIGIEAYDLYKFGVDRNNVSYPAHLISWGSGQNALYAYLLLPLIPLLGLSVFAIRLPMLLAGILSLPLMYASGIKLGGKTFGLLVMFFLAISPWHIVNSRWAVESNILPFFFLTGFTLLLYAAPQNRRGILAAAFFALSLYAYGTAYVGAPVFFLIALPALWRLGKITPSQIALSGLVFTALALPIILFVFINTFHLESVHFGALTIPRLPVQARYETMAAVFGDSPLLAMRENLAVMSRLLWSQQDAYPWNFVAPFGYFYRWTFPLALLGFAWMFLRPPAESDSPAARILLTGWLAAALAIGLLHPTNLTRLNLIFTPLLFCMAYFFFALRGRIPHAPTFSAAVFSVAFVFFLLAYHGEEYQKRAASAFNDGILPAIEYAREKSDNDICFTESAYSLYIYVLFVEKMNPADYVNDLTWISPSDPADPARVPLSIGRYRFRLTDCRTNPQAAYILLQKETPPGGAEYKNKRFGKFQVYLPK